MTPLAAVRVGAALVLAPRDGGAAGGPWRALAPELEGRVASAPARHALAWDPEATAEGLSALSLHEHGEYLARTPPGARWDASLAGVVAPVGEDVGGAGLWTVAFRGRAGSAVLAADEGGRALVRLSIEVRTGKIDYVRDYRAMLDALAAARFGAVFALATGPTEVPVEAPAGGGSARASSPWEDFLLVRYIVRSGVLARALDAIARDPVRHLTTERRVVPTARATRLRPEDVATRWTGHAPPATVPETAPAPTLDTPENRFVAHALEALGRRASAVARAAPEGPLRASAAAHARALAALRARPVLAGVGPLSAAGALGSAALQRRPGYREVLGAWLCLEGGLRPAWRDADAQREGVRDTAALYERWCAVELAAVLGLAPAALLDAPEGVTATVGGVAVEVAAQRTFPRGAESYTMAFRPDFTLTAGRRRLHLDAKYQVAGEGEFLADAGEGGDATAPRAGLLKMHAYRDAIRGSWGAFVLYPGDDAEGVRFEAWGQTGGGIGALPLRPGVDAGAREAQRAAVRALVERFARGG